MTVEKPKNSLGHFLYAVQSRLFQSVDYIPINQWGFDEKSIELLKKPSKGRLRLYTSF